jgi:hypothetical protein
MTGVWFDETTAITPFGTKTLEVARRCLFFFLIRRPYFHLTCK